MGGGGGLFTAAAVRDTQVNALSGCAGGFMGGGGGGKAVNWGLGYRGLTCSSGTASDLGTLNLKL